MRADDKKGNVEHFSVKQDLFDFVIELVNLKEVEPVKIRIETFTSKGKGPLIPITRSSKVNWNILQVQADMVDHSAVNRCACLENKRHQ